PAGAARKAFETPAQQIAFFDEAPLAEQIASLEHSLEEIERDPQAFSTLVGAWMAGDLGALEKLAIEPLREAAPVIYRRVVTERNAVWVREIDARLKGRGRTVVVVGVGHLIGPEGLPAKLRALGYSVEGP
ncbi:TraB/GumN family protein, partial [Phenylobacterium sp.]|uniref:TraB/GumN family protein n=1 Tax=Phenylobacterium sp. TaxID=1871053 RepID=UPI002E32849F